MAVIGTHMLFYTTEPEALRAQLRDAFGFKHVDAGGGWLIFALPPSEIGVHPGEGPNWESGIRHEISFMCDDIVKTVADLRKKGVSIDDDSKTQSYGITTTLRLPGGCKVLLYQPRHKIAAAIKKAPARKTRPAKRVTAKKGAASASAKGLRRDTKKATPPRGRQATKASRRR